MTSKSIQNLINEHVISRVEAVALNMGKLTTPYNSAELHMLVKVINDMRNSNINYGLVKTSSGIEVWRTGMKTLENE